jgi:hypothetical protein
MSLYMARTAYTYDEKIGPETYLTVVALKRGVFGWFSVSR